VEVWLHAFFDLVLDAVVKRIESLSSIP